MPRARKPKGAVKKQDKLSVKKVIYNNLWMLKKVCKYAPFYVIFSILIETAWGIVDAIGVLYLKELFDIFDTNGGFGKAAKLILSYALVQLVYYAFHYLYWEIFAPASRRKLGLNMHKEMFGRAIKLDLCKYDDPKFYNDFIWAMNWSQSYAIEIVENNGKLINKFVSVTAVLGIITDIEPLIAVVIIAITVVDVVMNIIRNRTSLKYFEERNPIDRKSGYIDRVFRLPDYSKELRVTRVKENLFEEYSKTTEKSKKLIDKYGKKWVGFDSLSGVTYALSTGAPLIISLYKIMISKTMGIGGFAAAVNAGRKVNNLLKEIFGRLTWYQEIGIFLDKVITFYNCEPEIKGGELTAEKFESLTIKNLTFSYGEGEEKKTALSNVDLTIKKGEKIAIVGYNGAGKTTLTKLIMRLYDPCGGEILYNGKSLKEYTLESIRSRIAAVFQDYRIFACTVAENVAGGYFDSKDTNKVLSSLKKSTFEDKLATLSKGIDTQLTREFDGSGTQLSGGEQQKIAIARAFYKDSDLIILDEPSSALDPDAEYNLNRAITEYAEDKTVIFISHRLSTTRTADRIYMFDSGNLIECGSHEELMNKNGKYAYMFKLQGEKYKM